MLVTTVVPDTATVTALVSGAGARGGPFIITNISRENLLIPSLAAGAGAGASQANYRETVSQLLFRRYSDRLF